MTRGPILFVFLILLVCVGVFMFTSETVDAPVINISEKPQDTNNQAESYKNRRTDIESYIGTHISELSPVQEVLGGKFFVTDIYVANGEGTVTYEDGHMQYTADFRYTENEDTGYTITKFTVRGQE